ncbi:MAG: helix-turn-helix transcriptional regulator [Burkholderiaceae bacterium]|nr:helix-turn-helix transcriptional regulator [Burkholderiaceae bacterium]
MTVDALRAWQKRMGYTYDTAAQALGIGRTTYADYLRTGKIPRVVFLATLAIEKQLPSNPRQFTQVC